MGNEKKFKIQKSKFNPPAGGQDLRFLAITQIPDQVRNDGTALVILTKVRICLILNQVQNDANRGRHSDESAGWQSKVKSFFVLLLNFDLYF